MEFNTMIDKHYRGSNLFLKCETSDDILEVIKDLVERHLNKYYPHSYYAKRKLEFLVNSENLSHQIMLQELFRDNKLIEYLLGVEEQVRKFINIERSKNLEKYKINDIVAGFSITERAIKLTTLDNELRVLANEIIILS